MDRNFKPPFLASRLWAVEVGRPVITLPVNRTARCSALAPDKFVGVKTARRYSHLFDPGDINLSRPVLIKLGTRRSIDKLVGPFFTHRQRELEVKSLVAFSNQAQQVLCRPVRLYGYLSFLTAVYVVQFHSALVKG